MSTESATKRQRADEEGSAVLPANAFTVVLRGTAFTLSREECEFDSPNYFTSCFLSDFSESESRVVHTNRSPALFPHIQNWLSGYDVLPLPPIADMSPTVALGNLLKDAQYFGLTRLEEQITFSLLPYPAALSTYGFDRVVTLHDLLRGKCPLEKDVSKHTPQGLNLNPFVPVKGGKLPPIVLMRDVGITIQHESLNIDFAVIRAGVGFTRAGVAVKETTDGLIFDSYGSYSFHKTGEEEMREPDAHLILDGINTTFSDLNDVLHHAVPVVVRGLYSDDDLEELEKPLAKTILQHLQLSDRTKLPPEEELGDAREYTAHSSFELFASELWMVPVVSSYRPKDSDIKILQAISLRIVAAKCHTRGAGMFVAPTSLTKS